MTAPAMARWLFHRVAPRVVPGWYQRRAALAGARAWDMLAEPDEQFYVEEYLHFLRPALASAPGKRVLDLGCGHGRLAIPLARAGYEVTGVDWSPDALAGARRHGALDAGVILHEADAAGWMQDAPAESYDAMIALEILYMLDAWESVLAHAARVVVPGGVCAFGFRPLLYYLRYHAQRGELDLLERISAVRDGRLGTLRFNWHTRDEIVGRLTGLGFRKVQCVAIGLLSGLRGDPLEHVARPAGLDASARAALLDAELRWAEAFPDEGRYMLALAWR